MDLGLKGRKAIVTGGSLGIGKAIARGARAGGRGRGHRVAHQMVHMSKTLAVQLGRFGITVNELIVASGGAGQLVFY